MRVDEMHNDWLRFAGRDERVARDELVAERVRVEDVIRRHTMSGDDLSYWHERVRIIDNILEDV